VQAVIRSVYTLSDCSTQAKVGKVPLSTNMARVFLEEGELSTADIAAVCPVSCSTKYSNFQNIIFFIVNGLRSESVHKLLPVLVVKHLFLAISSSKITFSLFLNRHRTCSAPETSVRSFNAFHGSRNIDVLLQMNCHTFLLVEVMLYFHDWYFMNSWNRTLVLHSKYIATFNIVLSVPINHLHSIYTVQFC
jgi:hypothetical protein